MAELARSLFGRLRLVISRALYEHQTSDGLMAAASKVAVIGRAAAKIL
jgi:hypothetical protein